MPKPLTQFGQRGIGALLEFLAYHSERRMIVVGLATAGMRPRRNLPGAAALSYELLDKRTADAKERREGPLRATVCVISTEDFLAKIEGIGSHSAHIKLYLPFIQLQTALGFAAKDRLIQGAYPAPQVRALIRRGAPLDHGHP